MSWRDMIKIHPAADLFPLLGDADLVALGNDIKTNGLTSPIAITIEKKGAVLCDGRNRLDAMERIGLRVRVECVRCVVHPHRPTGTWKLLAEEQINDKWVGVPLVQQMSASVIVITTDPVAYITSVNIHRRHLTLMEKKELAAALIKENPERSNRAVGELAKIDDKTVGAVRRGLESTADIPQLKTRTGKDGKARPASKPKTTPTPTTKFDATAAVLAAIPPRDACLMEIRSLILDGWLPQIPQAQWVDFVKELFEEIEDIKAVIEKRTGPIKIMEAVH
jgi:hypothetical protein